MDAVIWLKKSLHSVDILSTTRTLWRQVDALSRLLPWSGRLSHIIFQYNNLNKKNTEILLWVSNNSYFSFWVL